jgi:multiple sugar transport system substrate-binding protein
VDRRKFLALAATGAAGAAGVTAVGCGRETGGAATTLTMIAADYGDPDGHNSSQGYWNALSRAFSRKHPGIRVDVGVYSWNEVDKRVADMVKEGHPPDMAQIGAYANFAEAGKLYSANELLSIPVQADFLSALAEAGEMTRVQYGMPFVASTRLLFYNKSLFKKAGLDPDEPPKTWKELAHMASSLKSVGVRVPYGLPLGPEEAPAEALMWMFSGGGAYTDNVGAYTIDEPENTRTFTWLRDNLVGKGLTNPDPGGTNRAELFDAFARGDVGMLNGHPTLMQQADQHDVEYGTAALPGRHGPSKGSLGVADWLMAFKKEGEHREPISQFLDFVYSEKNHYAFVDRYDLLPVTTSASERMRHDRSHKKLWRFLDQLSKAEFYPVGKVSWAQVSADIKKNIGRAVAKHGDPGAVLGALQREAEAEDSEANGGQ